MNIVFDIGGTNIRAALFSKGDQLIKKVIEPTPQKYEDAIEMLKRLTTQLSNQQEAPAGIALVAAGVLDTKQGVILVSPNLSQWEKRPLVQDISTFFHGKIVFGNDAIAAGLGEARFGAGKGMRIVAYLTLSTGVGGARIVDGKVDANAWGFEPGSQIINIDETKTTGHFLPGGLESYVSGTAFQKLYGIAPKDCTDDSIWNTYARHLAAGLTNAIVLWSPDIVVLGGGVSKAADKFLPQVQKYLDQAVIFPQMPPIVVGTLGDEAGLWGGITLLQ